MYVSVIRCVSVSLHIMSVCCVCVWVIDGVGVFMYVFCLCIVATPFVGGGDSGINERSRVAVQRVLL